MTEPTYPDFLIRCTSHSASALGSIEAKYRWEGAMWLPASVRGKLNVEVTTLRGNEVDDWLSVAVDGCEAESIPLEFRRSKDALPIREKHEIRCGSRICRNRIPVTKDSLQWVFIATTVALRQSTEPHRRQPAPTRRACRTARRDVLLPGVPVLTVAPSWGASRGTRETEAGRQANRRIEVAIFAAPDVRGGH